MDTQILYLFDPLCGWCYGFSDTIYQFSEKYSEQHEFVPIPGGMVVGDQVKPFREINDFISDAYKKVEELSGCTFGNSYLEELLPSNKILDSEPPSRALITFRTFDAGQSIKYAKDLQYEHFYNGKDYNDTDWYGKLASNYGIDPQAFDSRFNELKMKQHVQEEFAWVRESGVQGYPTVVLRRGQKYYLLSNGYVPLEKLEESLQMATKRI